MGYRFFLHSFFFILFVRFPLCKMFVQICFRTDGCCTKFEHVKHRATDRQPEGHSSIAYITYVHMLRRCVCLCRRLCRLISCPCLLTMMMMMMVMDGQQEHTTSQHTTHEYTNRSIIFGLQFHFFLPFGSTYTTFWPTVPKQKYCGLIEAFFQLDHSLSYHCVCSSSFHPHTHTHTRRSQRKHINFSNCSDFKHFSPSLSLSA